jgi:endonuclease/exonuclease/phosphatase family metal-dependent hydrolase
MRRKRPTDDLIAMLFRVVSNPRRNWPLGLALLVAALIFWWATRPAGPPSAPPDGQPSPPVAETGQPGEYLFCFWNVENLFDDQEDRRLQIDKPYDNWFAHDAAARSLKYQHLSDALVKLNGGRGPDILACVEVESVRAAELLRDALNQRLADPALHYTHVLMKEVSAGRHIAPAVITRLPVREGETHLLASQLRILEGHIDVNGHDLTLIASHWTSHRSDDEGGKRERYGDMIYKEYRRLADRDPGVDLLVCGDFNDSPDDQSVREGLHTASGRGELECDAPQPRLLNLMAGKDPNRYGTHYFHRLLIYDQIVVSCGMLDDRGWSCDPDSVTTVNSLVRQGTRTRAPWRFGNEKDTGSARGYSDHFPVTVRLKVR